ncbi:antirestriction protein [Methylomonas koyamae]|uniref:antirestriction protein n=1 Tax=Methylomonas koyamae TaxID=702114 RepID=UPI0006D0133C|nr:antirestriction protein [Methylomonas koyamae]BBL56984.1 hypothetical protein MKFW12EY_05970 [Methylomonas koyamae]
MSEDEKDFSFVEAWGEERLGFNEKFFGDCLFDLKIFDMTNVLMPAYSGGYWKFMSWKDTVAFYVLDGAERVTLRNFSGDEFEIDSTLAGMVITFFALNLYIERTQNEKLMDKWDRLRELIYNYAEEIGQAREAFKMLD